MANSSLPVVTIPFGRYHLPAGQYFNDWHSNMVMDWSGSHLYLYPEQTGGWYPFHPVSTIDAFVDPESPTRNASKLSGTITTGTTQLTMDAGEIENVQPGEVVTIQAGVGIDDPVEPHKSIVATVASVSGAVITFTEPLGVNVPTYSSFEELEGLVNPLVVDKVGPWGEDYNSANYKKGLGTEHGLLRYQGGGMKHDITIRNLNLVCLIVPDDDNQVGMDPFWATDILRLTYENISAYNLCGQALFLSQRCHHVTARNIRFRGEGRSVTWTDQTMAPAMFVAYGGDNFTFEDIDIDARNLAITSFEAGVENVTSDRIRYRGRLVHDWIYGSDMNLFGHHVPSGLLRHDNLDIDMDGQLSAWVWKNAGATITYNNLTISDSAFLNDMDFRDDLFEGTLTFTSGSSYGALVSDTETLVLPQNQKIYFPDGLYKSARLRVTTPGSITAILDGWDQDYSSAIAGTWRDVNSIWKIITAGSDALSTYHNKTWIRGDWSGSNSATIECEVQYYPKSGGLGWRVQ